jgi:succinyl-CoA synthetase beta subunit
MAVSCAFQRAIRNASLRLSPVAGNKISVRHLNLHEYQSKELMNRFGITVQKFKTAETPEEAGDAAYQLDVPEIVLKAQILAGGRGKGVFSSGLKGGVKVTRDIQSISGLTRQMINHRLTTKQTSPDGVLVNKVSPPFHPSWI